VKLADRLESCVTPVWRGAFYAMGRVARNRTRLWESNGRQRVLAIAPHPDDEAVGCVGTLLLHGRSGDAVSLACITDGSRSRAQGLGPDRMRAIRKQEAESAACLLKANHFDWIGLPEGSWSFEALAPRLLAIFRQLSPDIVYAPSRVDFHPEHQKVAHALARLLLSDAMGSVRATVRVYQLQVPLTPVLTNLVTDCSSVSGECAAVLLAYRSQSANTGRAVRMWHYAALRYGMKRHAEEFWEMSAEQYCHLHTGSPESWRYPGFRGVRYHSFTDPLSYLSGLNERRRLRNMNR
jgi:N-acetylglucosamine malate deacetylase 1